MSVYCLLAAELLRLHHESSRCFGRWRRGRRGWRCRRIIALIRRFPPAARQTIPSNRHFNAGGMILVSRRNDRLALPDGSNYPGGIYRGNRRMAAAEFNPIRQRDGRSVAVSPRQAGRLSFPLRHVPAKIHLQTLQLNIRFLSFNDQRVLPAHSRKFRGNHRRALAKRPDHAGRVDSCNFRTAACVLNTFNHLPTGPVVINGFRHRLIRLADIKFIPPTQFDSGQLGTRRRRHHLDYTVGVNGLGDGGSSDNRRSRFMSGNQTVRVDRDDVIPARAVNGPGDRLIIRVLGQYGGVQLDAAAHLNFGFRAIQYDGLRGRFGQCKPIHDPVSDGLGGKAQFIPVYFDRCIHLDLFAVRNFLPFARHHLIKFRTGRAGHDVSRPFSFPDRLVAFHRMGPHIHMVVSVQSQVDPELV